MLLQQLMKLLQRQKQQSESATTRADMAQVSRDFSRALVANWEYYANGTMDIDEWMRRAEMLARNYPPALPQLREKLLREEGIIQ